MHTLAAWGADLSPIPDEPPHGGAQPERVHAGPSFSSCTSTAYMSSFNEAGPHSGFSTGISRQLPIGIQNVLPVIIIYIYIYIKF